MKCTTCLKSVSNNEIIEFVGLRSKMYSFTIAGGGRKNRAAGVKKAIAVGIRHQDYKETLRSTERMSANQAYMRSKNHDMYIINMDKATLSPYDDKRYLLPDGISTLAYGHRDIELYEGVEDFEY